MIEDTLYVPSRKVSCEGGTGALGHPKIYLEIGKEDEIYCPYCSKLFIYKKTPPEK